MNPRVSKSSELLQGYDRCEILGWECPNPKLAEENCDVARTGTPIPLSLLLARGACANNFS
jgi:hypothetical protein